MPIEMQESEDSPSGVAHGANARVDRRYVLKGSDDCETVRDYVLANTPTNWLGLVRSDPYVDPLKGLDDWWIIVVTYIAYGPGTTTQTSFSFDTTGGSTQIYTSRQTVGAYSVLGKAGIETTNYGGLINVTSEGVQGVEIETGGFVFAINKSFDVSDVDATFLANLYALTKNTNNASYTVDYKGNMLTFLEGELRFRGAVGSERDDRISIDFQFVAEPNLTGFSIGGGLINGINKKGHEYLWVSYRKEQLAAANIIVEKPIAAYVEQVYKPGDFDNLPL